MICKRFNHFSIIKNYKIISCLFWILIDFILSIQQNSVQKGTRFRSAKKQLKLNSSIDEMVSKTEQQTEVLYCRYWQSVQRISNAWTAAWCNSVKILKSRCLSQVFSFSRFSHWTQCLGLVLYLNIGATLFSHWMISFSHVVHAPHKNQINLFYHFSPLKTFHYMQKCQI